jgi:hypothetical protein
MTWQYKIHKVKYIGEKQWKEKEKTELSTTKLQDNFKQPYINILEVPQKRGEKETNIWSDNGQNVSKFHENYKLTDPQSRSSTNSKHKENGEENTKAHHN